MTLPFALADRCDFEIAIICALPLEASAVEALLDKIWEDDGIRYGKAKGDPNAYTTGVIGGHNVVLAHMPHMGKVSAAGVAASLSSSFTEIKLALIVGICGAVPFGVDGKKEILLGDVIMSEALVQYDFGRQYPDIFQRKDTLEDNLGRANIAIRSMLRKLQTARGCQRIEDEIARHLASLTQKVNDARYPGPEADVLFEPSYRHVHRNDDIVCPICIGNTQGAHKVCEYALGMSCHQLGCDPSQHVVRRRLSRLQNMPDAEDVRDTQSGEVHRPQIHIGRMGSGDTVMKSGEHRDEIARRYSVIAFEMEGAGIWDYFPSLVIKGVCDYADSHKKKEWQAYAATTAAACTKAFLDEWASENHSSSQDGPNKITGNVYWTVPRPVNNLFTGREDILGKIEDALRRNFAETEAPFQKRFILTGMGGQGKSEICLKIANTMRQCFWGVFWVDVSNSAIATKTFLDIARKLHGTVETLEEARQVLANTDHSWLLILDNADDPHVDYQIYFPPGTLGVVLMTSRIPECRQYATLGFEALEGLDVEDAVCLLLRAAKLPSDQWPVWKEQGQVVTDLLKSHPLALIQAGAYVSRGHCTLSQYPQVFQRHHQRLLQFRSEQARSRYEHVYATFDASAQVLESKGDQTAQDALHLLSILSMLSPEEMPMAIFEAAWQGAQWISRDDEETDDMGNLLQWHVSKLPSFIETEAEEWDSLRVVEASHLLVSLALITENSQRGLTSISMHPLTHVWARIRQNQQDQNQAWMSTGCIIGLSRSETELWQVHERQLRPHLHSYLDQGIDRMFSCIPQLMIARIIIKCGWQLLHMRDDSRLFALLQSIFEQFNINTAAPLENWLSLYELTARNSFHIGRVKEAVQQLEQVVKIREQTLTISHPDRLTSQHELARVYKANGQVSEAIQLLGQVVEIEEQTLSASHPDRLASQHELAGAYIANGQVSKAIQLLKQVVEIREQTLSASHPHRLASQHELVGAYQANGQIDKAISLMEKVVEMDRKTLQEDHPNRVMSQDALTLYYGIVRNQS